MKIPVDLDAILSDVEETWQTVLPKNANAEGESNTVNRAVYFIFNELVTTAAAPRKREERLDPSSLRALPVNKY